MRIRTLAPIAFLAVIPLLAASQVTPTGEAPKVQPPAGGQLGALKGPFMRDGRPIKTGDRIELFNGTDTKGWKAFVPDLAKEGKDPLSVWTAAHGVLQCAGTPVGYIQTEELYDHFILELEWRFEPSKGEGNSGVLLRTIGEDSVWPKSMEAQLHSRNAGDFWNIGEYAATVDAARTNGRHTAKKHPTNEKPLGEWNKYRIIVNEGEIELWVNGLLQNVATGVEANKGRIALQSEGAYIEFRNIELTKIVP
jgi:Domain of Unknown Function (DUF1080)